MQVQLEKTQCPKCFATLRCKVDARRVKCPKCQYSFQAFHESAEEVEAIECEPPPIIQANLAGETQGKKTLLANINWVLVGKISGAILAAILLLSFVVAVLGYVGNDKADKSLLQIPGATVVVFLFAVVTIGSFIGTTALYLTPIYVAYVRKHPNLIPIAIISAAAGWTVIGWAGCLAWAFSDTRR